MQNTTIIGNKTLSQLSSALLLGSALSIPAILFSGQALADDQDSNTSIQASTSAEDDIKDMSDPLAIYTQAGFGVTDKGINIKVGQTYDTGDEATMAMNIIEIKGIAGETLGWSGNSSRDDSIDSFRVRNFKVNLENGRGTQIDLNYNIERESLDSSYSFIQALPSVGGLNIYPLGGLGLNMTNGEFGAMPDQDNSTGYTLSGVFAVVGAYAKYAVTDKIWINYNPMWLTTLSGSDNYVDNAFGKGNSSIFLNEFAISYQITPRFNARYFANWSQDQNYLDGDQRIEFNYQF